MPDFIGRIEVPEVAASGTFPLQADYPIGRSVEPAVAVHRFESGNGKIEQRFLLGPGQTRYFFQRRRLSYAEETALADFWEARSGPYQPFTYNAPNEADNGATTTARTVLFEDEPLTLEKLEAQVDAGLTFVEVPTSTPSYAVTKTVERFPDAAFESALLGQQHEIVPLVRIRVNESAVDDILLSDRRVTVDGDLYLPRLLGHQGVGQTINGEADSAVFVFGNADGVMRELADDTDLRWARIEFKFYHVGAQTLVEFWAGHVRSVTGEAESEIALHCSDPMPGELAYPRRTVSRHCRHRFDDGKHCPFTAQGSLNGSFPDADASSCDKGFATPNGCQAHNMDDFHGGTPFAQDRVRLKAQNTGLGFGVGRKLLTVSSVQNESTVGQPIPEVWSGQSLPVTGLLLKARDEQEFLDALAVICEGPVTLPSVGHRLDGQPHHGPGGLGLRLATGALPQTAPFGLTASGDPDPEERSGGTAFLELRRTDEEGLQLTQANEHELLAVVSQGLSGYEWASGVRSSVAGQTNAVWVAANAYLRALWAELDSDAEMKDLLDVDFLETQAAFADASVTKLVGSGSATQFLLEGVFREQRPFREWLREMCECFLGYWTFKFGKLRIGTRVDSVAVEAYTEGNIVDRSLQRTAAERPATRWTYQFATVLPPANAGEPPQLKTDEVTLADDDAAKALDPLGRANHTEQHRSLAGVVSRDQAARVLTTRLREHVGGVTAAERRRHRRIAFETTVLALASEPGQVVSVTHPKAPGGACEMRIERFELRADWSVRIEGLTTVDSMYDLTVGSTAADVEPDDLPDEVTPELLPAWVTSFNAQEDPAAEIDPKTGQSLSLITVAYNEPTAADSPAYRGVEIWVQEFDGTDAGTPGTATNEPRLITKIAKNAAPEERAFTYPTTGKVLRVYGPSYGPNGVRAIEAATPRDDVLLDGKQSAPTQPADPHCQIFPDAIELSADKGPEPDLDVVLIAFTGDKQPWDLSEGSTAIKDSQIVGELRAAGIDGRRWRFRWRRPVYLGQSDGTTVTLDEDPGFGVDQWLVETTDGGFEGVNVQFLVDGAPVENHEVLSNTANTLTFAAASIPTGRVRLRIGGADGSARFYSAQRDKSGNVSQWAAHGPCTPLAPDGTTDRDTPLVHSPAPGSFESYWTAGATGLSSILSADAAKAASGVVGVQVAARSETEAETDADLASMYSIRGLQEVEIELTYSRDGSTGLEATAWRFPWSGSTPQHKSNPQITGWVTYSKHVITLPGQKVASGRARVRNSIGWGPWATIFAEFVRPGGGAVFTGYEAQRTAALTVGGAGGSVQPPMEEIHVIYVATSDLTINAPTPTPEVGERFVTEIRIPTGAGAGPAVSWAAAYKGAPNVSRVRGTKTVVEWRAESGSSFQWVNISTGSYEA